MGNHLSHAGDRFRGLLFRQLDRPRLQKIVDKAFYEVADIDRDQPDRVRDDGSREDSQRTINFAEAYIATLLVYNELNKIMKQTHIDPPTREEVRDMLKSHDKNQNGVLDRHEFEGFIVKLTEGMAVKVGRTLLVLFVIVPGLVFATKRVTRPIPRVNAVVQKVPDVLWAVTFTALLTNAGVRIG